MVDDWTSDDGLTRRGLLERAGLAGLAAVLAQLPPGLVAEARAQAADVVVDTFNGMAAFSLPGDDAYSVAQGQTADGPGGVAAGVVPVAMATFDDFASPDPTMRASAATAALLNRYANDVNPNASRGGFPSHFARLSFAEKADVFRRFESDPQWEGTALRFAAGTIPGLFGLLAFSEVGAVDRRTRQLTKRPIGWDIAGYQGVAEGRAELRGYWEDLRAVRPSARTRRWEAAERRRAGRRAGR